MALLTFHFALDFVILAITAFVGFYLYMTRNFGYWKKRGVVEVPPIPFIGNFARCALMKISPGDFCTELYNKFPNERYVGFYIFDRPFLLVRDPDLVRNVLLRDFNYFTDRFTSAHDDLSAPNIFFANNPGWKVMRSKLTPTFTSGRLKKMFELMLGVGENLKIHLKSLKPEGHVLEIKELCAKFATDIIGATAFGLDVNSLNNPNAEFRKLGSEIFRFTTLRSMEMTTLFFAPQLGKLVGARFLSKHVTDYLRGIFWETVAQRKQTGVRRDDLIDRLMDLKGHEAVNAEYKYDFNGDNLVAQAAAFFNAGFETISTTVSFTLYELALSSTIQTRLRREIKDALENNNGVINYDMVMSSSYLDMVISETLRKYPTLPFLDRVTISDYKVADSDLIIEKGTPVYIPAHALHYDPQFFPDPEVFDPERFTEENKRNRTPYVYLPFGEGPRNCIGMRFALLESKLAIIHIISEYEVLPCEKTLIPMKLDPKALLVAAVGGLFLKIRKISDADD